MLPPFDRKNKNKKKEEFVQEYLYIEPPLPLEELPELDSEKPQEERGIVVIELI